MIPDGWAARMRGDILKKAEILYQKAVDLNNLNLSENILPPCDMIFRALYLTPPENTRCVILGQDPYPTPGVANGLAFSANPGQKIPASLRNIFRELTEDIKCNMPSEPDLTPWAEQGVLLLNANLTVIAGKPGSCVNWGWQEITGDILRVCMELNHTIAFLFWGGYAHKVAKTLDFENNKNNKIAFYSSHPSPLGARHGNENIPAFLGSRPFSRVNQYFISQGETPIDWKLI